MSNIQAAAFFLVILAFSTICCGAREMEEDSLESPTRRRQYMARKLLEELLEKRTTGSSVCQGNVGCSDVCTNGATYDGSATCGLTCNSGPIGAFGSATGSVGSSGMCDSQSTFCRNGTYTIVRNRYSTGHFDCANAWNYGCAGHGGCCVRIGDSSNKNYYCIKCEY
ncbi:hypothetical protein I4U23_002031 [Adineta vaga]|nr:hypothetical protein I4U23_002031 [Adineta vaga]